MISTRLYSGDFWYFLTYFGTNLGELGEGLASNMGDQHWPKPILKPIWVVFGALSGPGSIFNQFLFDLGAQMAPKWTPKHRFSVHVPNLGAHFDPRPAQMTNQDTTIPSCQIILLNF